ncbi:TPA: restriction endonuclease subunit S, partial [Streptococcus suis]|nr:restriction endonuclease subunit S [Streptococcus suis]
MKTSNNIPAYRFQGYTDAWELRKLGEVATFAKGKGYSKQDLVADGSPIILYGRLYTKYETIISEIDTFISVNETRNAVLSEGGEVLVPASGESPADIARASVVTKKGIILGGDLNIIRLNSKISPIFLALTISNREPQKELSKRAQGKSVVHLHNSDLKEVEFVTPTLPEQSAIGTFFSTLDRHITLHQRKLDTLKEQKKTYLKLLFPAKGQTKPALRFQGFEDDWKEVKLGELCDIRTGKLDANAMVENGEYDFYTSGIKKYRIDVAEFEGPAITIAGNGATVGYMHLADGKFNAYQRTYVLTNFKVDRSYIFSEIAKKLPIKIQQEVRTGNIPYIVLSM